MTNVKATYDRRADVLYVSTERNGAAYGREGEDGLVWRYLTSDDSVVGVTVLDFDAYWKAHISDLAHQVSSKFHIPVNQAARVFERV